MLKFAGKQFGEHIHECWMDFNLSEFPPSMDSLQGEEQVFVPYFLFDWDPNPAPSRRKPRLALGVVVQSYIQEKAHRLSELEHLILTESISRPLSFYEVVRCTPGLGMTLRDVLIGGETEVEEHSGSQSIQVGDLLYGQLCRLPEVTTLGRMAPVAIPPGRRALIVEVRAQLRRKIAKQNRELAAEDLIRYAEMIRSAYLDIRDTLRMPPRLSNTDGDLLAFHTLKFETGSAQVTFDALAPLAWGDTKEDLLEIAEMDSDGTLRTIEFDWRKKGNQMHPTWDNTIMGHLRISGRSLVVEVNSASRARKIREEIEKRLGMLAVHRSTEVKSAQEMLQEQALKKASRTAPARREDVHVIDPEVHRHFDEHMQKEFLDWVNKRIPALGGRTPRQAVTDPDGREIVESLLLDWERHYEDPAEPGGIRPDFAAIRKLLHL